jgi:hypothetical protein
MRKELLKYSGLAFEIVTLLGFSVWLGRVADQYLETQVLFTILLPLVAIVGLFIKIYRETNK